TTATHASRKRWKNMRTTSSCCASGKRRIAEMQPRRAAVLGHPVAHSLSPVLHRSAYTELGLDGWEYQRHDVDADELAAFLATLDDRSEERRVGEGGGCAGGMC